MQKDNIYGMANIVTQTGDCELMFLGFQQQTLRGAKEYFQATKDAVEF